jgi:polysaccharide export outer membrane protein
MSAEHAGLRPGDGVMVMVWREEDLSGTFVVDDRGIVTLPLIGERDVTGLETSEIRDRLLAAYREYLKNPSIEVTVLRRINIIGAVAEPGLYSVDATVSLSDALGLAGGITPAGDSDKIRLIRGNEMVRRKLEWSAPIGYYDVRSGDQIFVGERSWLARNSGTLVGSLIAAATGLTIALIR